ncbi:MAG TPA: hypothetical protein VEI28_05100 [Thermodesulfovibrionales bacterium]|nr:hypothetical protein [Thermodesulfovibrionales bacterium]
MFDSRFALGIGKLKIGGWQERMIDSARYHSRDIIEGGVMEQFATLRGEATIVRQST